ncbi:MAG: histidinol-phosphatase HisJ family protein [Anaerovoracaceae bacterium]|jgi:histidinol-phosphatase (PHP family)|nr:histidinol-phosphatase HisJ family protein [Clostridiales bacterium]
MYDYHTHSSFSDDSHTPMNEMIETAINLGFKEIAITDHYDPDYPDQEYPFEIDFLGYHKSLNEAKETYKGRIKVVKGIEMGIQHGKTLEKCITAAKSYDYDFILGSFHCAEGMDLNSKAFFEGRSIEDSYIAFYTYMLNCLKSYKEYDILGHINVIDRYAERITSPSVYMDLVDEILKIIIYDGKGIEINTSSYRFGLEDTTPSKKILQRYIELGGEIVTIGSDAHIPRSLGYCLDRGIDMIKSAGIRYLATFDQRKAHFVPIKNL